MKASNIDRVVVTGGKGFFGRYICRALEKDGIEVVALGARDYNLVDQRAVQSLFKDLRPSIIVHAAAACGGIGANIANPGKFLHDNAMMGLQLLEEGRKADLRKFVLISTTCAYPEKASMPLREISLWDGSPTPATGPYGIAKRMLHEACRSFEQQYGLSCSVLLPANLYGPGDHFDEENSHVIAALIRRYSDAAKRGLPEIRNWGSGRPTREFIHVSDAAEAVRLALYSDTTSEPINIGTGVETSIRELAAIIAAEVGYKGKTFWDESKPDGQPRRCLDVSRATGILGFRAKVQLREGLSETVSWFKQA